MTPHAVLHELLTRWGDALAWHVAVSAVIIGAILLVTSLTRRAPARTRHGLLLLGLVQLVLPGMLLVGGFERAGLDVVGLLGLRHPPAASGTVTALVAGLPAPLPASSSGPSETRCLLLAVWGTGVLILAGLGAARLVRARRCATAAHGSPEPALLAAAAEAAKAAGLGATPRVELADVSTPRVVGVLRPRLVLPSGLPGRLDPAALDAVLAHELAHLARRDTLWQGMASLLLTMSWFNPLVWVAYRRLADEAELACDEAAVGRVGVASYVASLHTVCAAVVAAPVGATACMSSRRLARRVEAILAMAPVRGRLAVHRIALGVAAGLIAAGGVVGAAWATRNDPPPSPTPPGPRYAISATVTEVKPGSFQCDVEVTRVADGAEVMAPRVTVQEAAPATLTSGQQGSAGAFTMTVSVKDRMVDIELVERVDGKPVARQGMQVPLKGTAVTVRPTPTGWSLEATASRDGAGHVTVVATVTHVSTGSSSYTLHARPGGGEPVVFDARDGGEVKLVARLDTESTATVLMTVRRGGQLVELVESTVAISNTTPGPASGRKPASVESRLSSPITAALGGRDVSLIDFMNVVQRVSGVRVLTAVDLDRSVKPDFRDKPLRDALTEVLAPLGYTWVAEGDAIRIVSK